MRDTLGCWVVAAALYLSAPTALARETVARSPVHSVDHNFGCTIVSERLGPWKPRNMTVMASVASKFLLLRSVPNAKSTTPACGKMVPAGVIIRPAGEGNLQSYDLVVAMKDVRIHRAYSEKPFACGVQKPATAYGGFWSFEEPREKRKFRTLNAVCNEWNDVSGKISCTLKAGTVIAVGPTQSATCAPAKGCTQRPASWSASFAASKNPQIFLNLFNRPRGEVDKFLTNCQTSEWPGRE